MQYSKTALKILTALTFFLTLGCSPSNPSKDDLVDPPAPPSQQQKPEPTPSVVEGAINGRAWRMTQGRAHLATRGGRKYLNISLWNQSYDSPCTERVGSAFQARITAENRVRSAKIDNQDPFKTYPSIIFSDYTAELKPHQNMIASQGEVTIIAIEKELVRGRIAGKFPSATLGRTELEGDFAVPLCGSR